MGDKNMKKPIEKKVSQPVKDDKFYQNTKPANPQAKTTNKK